MSVVLVEDLPSSVFAAEKLQSHAENVASRQRPTLSSMAATREADAAVRPAMALAAEEAGEERTRRLGLGVVAGAALRARHVAHDLIDVLAAAGPGGFLAGLAGDGSTHGDYLSVTRW
jgi:hypothetical protein